MITVQRTLASACRMASYRIAVLDRYAASTALKPVQTQQAVQARTKTKATESCPAAMMHENIVRAAGAIVRAGVARRAGDLEAAISIYRSTLCACSLRREASPHSH